MERTTALRGIAANGSRLTPEELARKATELELPLADLYVLAGRQVPDGLLPPERDAEVAREFGYRASLCGHGALAELEEFVRGLPRLAAPGPFTQSGVGHDRPYGPGFATVFAGLMRNRGFGIRSLPFVGLSRSTLVQMVRNYEDEGMKPHHEYQLCAVAGVLGWTLRDLFAVAGDPFEDRLRPVILCRHLGRVFVAATHLTTDQLVQALGEADRLSGRQYQGVWRGVSEGDVEGCPDYR
ncbi:hypothetical protein [Kitasatospora sp. NPDC004289]